MLSTIQLALMPLSFGLLFFLMLLYWGQAAFFSYTKYKKFSLIVFYLAFASITSLLILRWVESGHFPLSNLYESLLFLSWSFLLGQLILQSHNTSPVPHEKSNKVPHLQKDEYELIHLLGVIISPLALISYAFAFINLPKEMQKATSLVPALQSNWLMMHVTIMILSYAALLCGSILSMAFLLIKFTGFRENRPQRISDAIKSEDPYSPLGVGVGSSDQLGVESAKRLISKTSDKPFIARSVEKGLGFVSKAVVGESDFAMGVQTLETSPDKLRFYVERENASPGGQDSLINFNPEQKEVFKNSFQLASKLDHSKQRLSSLCSRLDNLSYRMLGLGFPLLTIGILSGAVWANSAWGSYWSWDPKETWAFITWLVFAIYLHARITKGWSGHKPAIIATVGFFVVWFSYLGVNLIGTGLHSYGWFRT
uniref:heme attachment to plastid cytochrome c n=1 Tax=Phyllosiphon coccidium TaxID=1837062 RepID=UPI0024115C94|nr:heme attachment to plastid cytochrome c [Phyllosiphon coccidium]WDY12733.1 heme attachment to plastid cytochrome c [Phyllosiphon coccidium]